MKYVLPLLIIMFAAGCASTNVATIHDEGERFKLARDEAKLWEEGREIEYQIVRDGGKYENE